MTTKINTYYHFYKINDYFKVSRFINDTLTSNTYVIEYKNDVIIIDPGERENKHVITWLLSNNKKPTYCLITHEHFDHNIGYELIANKFNIKTFCSLETKEALKNSRKNLSLYHAIPFSYEVKNYTFEPPYFIDVIKTPGHSKGSICFLIDHCLFSGDTIIDKKHLVSKLPGGNKTELNHSISLIMKLADNLQNLKIFPGHGDPFDFDSFLKN
jgi:hydroxyacylglutathione hydrolase